MACYDENPVIAEVGHLTGFAYSQLQPLSHRKLNILLRTGHRTVTVSRIKKLGAPKITSVPEDPNRCLLQHGRLMS